MIHLALRSEYSFKKVYGFVENLANYSGGATVGIADDNNTFGHVAHHRSCKSANVKPILGVRLMVCDKPIEKKKTFGPRYIFLAKNKIGLSEIYRLVYMAYSQFYYHPRLFQDDLNGISENVIVIAPDFNCLNRIDYIGIDQMTPEVIATWPGIPKVAICKNWYQEVEDREVFQLHCGRRKMESQTFPQHILTESEWLRLQPDQSIANDAVTNTYELANLCDEYDLPTAPNLKYPGKLTLRELCRAGARKRKIDIDQGEYHDRLERELALIEERGFSDYFLVVAQMVRNAKQKMLVGPSRGSSGGSLVGYITGITEVNPLQYGLLFERFIDVNRLDMPDIDIDFPDKKRKYVIDSLSDMYGHEHVSRIATVAKMKPKSAIGEFAMELGIPAYETEEIKGAIVQRSSGDARATMRIEDTFLTTDIGKEFIKKYPTMSIVKKIETHARHAGVHAAGIVVCNDKLTNYGGVNARDGALMMDHRDAEGLNLLKIDCLGLRTLSILESVADQIGMPYSDYYNLPLDDEKVFGIFNSMRLSGIFQFQGNALQHATRMMGVHSFDDICAIGALARPGPIHSGGTNIFIGRRTGVDPVVYLSDHEAVVRATEATYGVIIYQEQLMMIAREYGQMTWSDVSALRKAASKSLGEEFFNKYKGKFVDGAIKNGADPDEVENVWDNMVTFGSWGFNKSHAYGYGMISYWTAWAKAYHPLEYAVANLNNTKKQDVAIKILRDMVRNDGVEYTAFDADSSVEQWSVHDGKLLGGLLSLKGIGPKKAKAILKARKGDGSYTPSMVSALMDPDTPFNILFPCEYWWGDIFENYEDYGLEDPPVHVETIVDPGEYVFIAKLMVNNLRDLNETQAVAHRGGRYLTDHTVFLYLTVEDDTSSIISIVDRYNYERIGRDITNTGRVEHDWYLIRGKIKDRWRRVDVKEIMNLNRWGAENGLGPDAPKPKTYQNPAHRAIDPE
jgi:DNA polymerase III alpha subunit